MPLYLAPWRFRATETEHGPEGWTSPVEGVPFSGLDLRPFGAGGIFAFAAPQTIPGAIELGDPDSTLRPPTRSAIDALFPGLALNYTTPTQLAWQLLTEHSDPAGLAGCKPIRHNSRHGKARLIVGNQVIFEEDLDAPGHRERYVAVFQNDYRRNRLTFSATRLRRFAGAAMLKIFPERAFDDATAAIVLPAEFVGDGYERPATTQSDTFDRAGESPAGAPWSHLDGDFDISSNQAVTAANASTWPLLSTNSNAVSGDDIDGQLDFAVAGTSNSVGAPAVRCAGSSSSTKTGYYGAGRQGGGYRYISKAVTGTHTDITTDTGGTAPPHTFNCLANGSDLELKEDSSSVLTTTDTAITGNTIGGIQAHRTDTTTVDNWQISDIAAGGGGNPWNYYAQAA